MFNNNKSDVESPYLAVTPSLPGSRFCFRFILGNRIGGVMVSTLASRAVYREFDPRSDQTKDYNIGIGCLSAKHAALRRKSNDWLVQNQDNVSEWGDMSIRRLLFQ